jgi:hypothetical protein
VRQGKTLFETVGAVAQEYLHKLERHSFLYFFLLPQLTGALDCLDFVRQHVSRGTDRAKASLVRRNANGLFSDM